MPVRCFTWLLFLGLTGCVEPKDDVSKGVRGPEAAFTVPVLTQRAAPQGPPGANAPRAITPVAPPFAGRYPFAPRLVVEEPEPLVERDFIQTNYLRRLEDSRAVRTDGLELVADYACTVLRTPQGDSVARRTFPVYVANATSQSKYVYGEGSRLYAIQEVQDRAGTWRPIERLAQAWCGGQEFALEVRPRHVVVFLANKYDGPFATRLRVRYLNRKTLYVSPSFAGYIHERQFLAPPGEHRLLEENPAAVRGLYLGAVSQASDVVEMR